ncbi:YkgJ family cysteine cluster protein [Aestuariibacter sp. GS-14]|uniref:YkgJ family cysteine cluster protein n=1 Tax=Aestuariibacter sp. GS-14 TaxID=2590670 RepID=UPI0015E849CE|nr:YkgJ family cysteine cluster protein [Aestuariibacter sp. GS-14]
MLSCVNCGACCASFRVSFYWSEADPFTAGTVPAELTEKISPTRVAMAGTNQPKPRCVALQGEVGKEVSCGIYPQRSSTCREFEAGSVECLKARVKHGIGIEEQIPVVAA